MLLRNEGRPGPAAAVPCRLALLAALSQEVRPFLRQNRARPLSDAGFPAWEFPVGTARGCLALTGMGEAAAGRVAGRAVALWLPEIIISLGFGGDLLPGLDPGQLVLGASYGRYDPHTGKLLKVEAPAPPRPLLELAEKLESAGLAADIGCFISTPGIIHKERQGGALQGLAQPVLDLESAAVAAAAAAAGISFLALRVITDAGGEEIPDYLREGWEPGYGPGLGQALGWLARDPRRLGSMLHLWRRSRLGAEKLNQALQVLLPLL